MKKITLLLLILVSYQTYFAQVPKGKAKVGTIYGAKTDDKDVIDASELSDLIKEKDTVVVKVKAEVVDVCSQKGCWMTFKVSDDETAFVKMKDYEFFVPLDLRGKTVVLDGIAFSKTTSVAELKHYAADAKKSQEEIDAITEPKSEIRFMANGILVVK